MSGKPKVAVHKFSSCDGCQLAFLNLGEDLLRVAELIEGFAHVDTDDQDSERLAARGDDRRARRAPLRDDAVDRFGVPVANVHYDDHANDIAMRNHGYRQMTAIHRAAGATRCIETPTYAATHNLGSNRMSARADDGVVDRSGCAHEVPNLFVADGSQFASGGAANPTLTIVALAIRQAGEIARRLSHADL